MIARVDNRKSFGTRETAEAASVRDPYYCNIVQQFEVALEGKRAVLQALTSRKGPGRPLLLH